MKRKGLLILVAFITIMSGTATAQKVGHINAEALLVELPGFKLADEEMQRYQKEKKEEIDNMIALLQKNATQLEADIAAGKLTEDIKNQRIGELQEKEQKIIKFQQDTQLDIQQKEASLSQPLVEKVKASIKKVGEENEYTYIYDSSVMHYIGAGADDITPLVRKDLGLE